jgi:hypothetical protein
MSDQRSRIKATILRKMLRNEYIGGRHTSLDNLPKGFPKHLRGLAKQVSKGLIRERFLIVTPKPSGLHVSLDPSKVNEIREILEGE